MAESTLVPHLVVKGGAKAVEFYTAAVGAEEKFRFAEPGGERLMHAELHIPGGKFYLCDEFPEYCGGKSRAACALGGSPVTLSLVVPDCDAAVARMEAAGGTVTMPPADMFWGDRYAKMVDPFGHEWSFSQRLNRPAQPFPEGGCAGANKDAVAPDVVQSA